MITPAMQQVLDDLAADTTAEWELVGEFANIRAGYGEGPLVWCCPLTWFFKAPEGEWPEAADRLGLSHEDAAALVQAADNWTRDVYLRQQLLAACRLPETA